MKEAGIDTVVCLPESTMRPLFDMVRNDDSFRFISVTNEGEGASIAGGAWLGGRRPVLMMENSGVRMACESLARLGLTFGIPVFMIMSHTGAIGETKHWAIPHDQTMEPVLDALRIPYHIVRSNDEIKEMIKRANQHISTSSHHVALVMSGETRELSY